MISARKVLWVEDSTFQVMGSRLALGSVEESQKSATCGSGRRLKWMPGLYLLAFPVKTNGVTEPLLDLFDLTTMSDVPRKNMPYGMF